MLTVLSMASEIVAPFLLGATLVLLVQPLRHALDRKGLPRWVGVAVVICAAYGILAVLAALLLVTLGQFTLLLNDLAPQINASTESVVDFLTGAGLADGEVSAVPDWLNPSVVLHGIAAAGESLLGAGSLIVFALIYVLYMAVDLSTWTDMRRHFAATSADRLRAVAIFVGSTRKYFVVNTIFGLVVAVLDGLAVWMLGIPGALIWAILAFVTNFIPSVGFIIGLIPPAVIGGVTGGWELALIVVLIYSLVNVLLQVFIQPRFVSRSVQLSLTLSFVSLVVWTTVLGPIGAILAVPMTLLVRLLLLSEDPHARWTRWLTGERVP